MWRPQEGEERWELELFLGMAMYFCATKDFKCDLRGQERGKAPAMWRPQEGETRWELEPYLGMALYLCTAKRFQCEMLGLNFLLMTSCGQEREKAPAERPQGGEERWALEPFLGTAMHFCATKHFQCERER